MLKDDDEVDVSQGGATASLASTFRGRNTAKSAEELKKARETRAAEALRMKDEQLKILSEQNATLLQTLDRIEEEANTIQMEKLAIEQENRSLRDTNFELQSKARAAETQANRMSAEVADKDSALRIMTDQNSELLRLLESEERLAVQLQSEKSELRAELDEIRQRHGALLTTAKNHEELATKAAREGQLRAEEIRLLRTETEQLKQQNGELKMKTMVEVEALQEQLRVRKEKQYQLLEKLQAQEEAKRQAEDQLAGMEEQLRALHARNVELETQLQVEARVKQNFEEANKELQLENGNLFNQNRDLQMKIEKSEKERLRMEAEARDSGDQLREMAEKVFQLLERLKLAELSKTKAMEALKKKEQDMVAIQKKNARLIKESTEEGRARVKAELDVKVLQDQVRVIKKNNQELAQKSKDEASAKVKALEEVEQLNEKLKTMDSRLSFLLNKVQMDEETRVMQADERKKLEAQVMSYTEKCDELQHKLLELGESNRVITQAMRLKQEELNELTIKFEALKNEFDLREKEGSTADMTYGNEGPRPGGPDEIDNVRLNEGRGRFFVEAKAMGGGSMLVLRGRKPMYRDWLDKFSVNDFLKRAQKNQRFRDMVIERMGHVYGLLMVEEEEKTQLAEALGARERAVEHLNNKVLFMQDAMAVEEDAKRRMLLRYIHAVKEQAAGEAPTNIDGTPVGGVLMLPESNISDEEVHALAALLRNNTSIEKLDLRGNNITDDGARALGAVLAGRSGLQNVDLRANKIGPGAIRILAEALERSERVRHVYVHAGGKIEALGTKRVGTIKVGGYGSPGGTSSSAAAAGGGGGDLSVAVETICVVDIRDNNPKDINQNYELLAIDAPLRDGNAAKSQYQREQIASQAAQYNPLVHLDSMAAPPRGMGPPTMITGSHGLSQGGDDKKKKKKKKSKVAGMAGSASESELSESEKRRSKQRAAEERLQALREGAWQGRAGTMDLGGGGGTDSVTRTSGKESLRLLNAKKKLPPLLEYSSVERSSTADGGKRAVSRGRSAPDPMSTTVTGPLGPTDRQHAPSSPVDMVGHSGSEEMVLSAIEIARKKKGVPITKPFTSQERALFESPFAQSLDARGTSVSSSRSPSPNKRDARDGGATDNTQ